MGRVFFWVPLVGCFEPTSAEANKRLMPFVCTTPSHYSTLKAGSSSGTRDRIESDRLPIVLGAFANCDAVCGAVIGERGLPGPTPPAPWW